jgi:hypothetical protein
MTRICAWCKKGLGETSDGRDSQVITHGICDECALNFKAQSGVSLHEFLECLKVPIFLVDSDVLVLSVNAAAHGLLRKDIDKIEGFRSGDVFECEYARLPGGCGNTVHCSGCAIRGTVTDTYRTGESHRSVRAYLKQINQGLDVTVSTEKIGDVVLLRVDGIEPRADE